MKTILALIALTLAACAGGESTSNQIPATSHAIVSTPDGPVVLMGDSLTYYWNVRSTTLQHIADYVDSGIPGETTHDMLRRFDTDVMAHNPGLVVILGGINDMYLEADPEIDYIAEMADTAAASGAKVIIGLVPRCGDWHRMVYHGYSGDEAVQEWNRSLVALARSHGYQVADYYSAMLNVGMVSGEEYGSQDYTDYTDDILHPNTKGYDAMWSVLEPLLKADQVELR